MTIQEIISSDPLFRERDDLTYEPLNGGFSNETYIISDGKIKYVVKINSVQNEYLNLTRKSELEAQSIGAALGIAPKVLSDVNQNIYNISEFINGRMMERDDIVQEENLIKLAETIKKFHSITGVDREKSAFDLIDNYAKGIDQLKVELPEGYHDILRQSEIIRKRRSLDTVNNHKFCHNDFLGNNLLYDGQKITVIDWELSGIGDPYMDLSSLSYFYNLSEEEDKLLIKSYFGYYEDEMYQNLKDFRYIGLVREVVWSFFYAGLNRKSVNHDFDYYGAGCYVLDRLKKGYLSLW